MEEDGDNLNIELRTVCFRVPAVCNDNEHRAPFGSDGYTFGREARAERSSENILGRL
jgi:hypothetical protein